MQIIVLGIDLGKNSCSVAGQDASGRIVVRRRVKREGLLALTAGLAPCVVAMEACCGAHHLGRAMQAQGHTIRLISPEYARRYVKAQKNDDRHAEGIAEAATRPAMRFVARRRSRERTRLQPRRALITSSASGHRSTGGLVWPVIVASIIGPVVRSVDIRAVVVGTIDIRPPVSAWTNPVPVSLLNQRIAGRGLHIRRCHRRHWPSAGSLRPNEANPEDRGKKEFAHPIPSKPISTGRLSREGI